MSNLAPARLSPDILDTADVDRISSPAAKSLLYKPFGPGLSARTTSIRRNTPGVALESDPLVVKFSSGRGNTLPWTTQRRRQSSPLFPDLANQYLPRYSINMPGDGIAIE
jgi:hypothetical protein